MVKSKLVVGDDLGVPDKFRELGTYTKESGLYD